MDSYPKRFSNKFGRAKSVYGALLCAAIFGFAGWVWHKQPLGYQGGTLVICSVGSLFALLSINATLKTSDIIVDGNGIAWALFGKEWRRIVWRDLKRIRLQSFIDREASLISPPLRTRYVLDVGDFRRPYFVTKGPITFTDTLQNFADLERILGTQIADNHIPVIDTRHR